MIALGCDHGGYELMQEVKHIWINRDWNIRTSDATATRQLIIRFTPEK